MHCSKYPEREAAGICAYSGKPYCAEELVEVDGRYYYKGNLDKVFHDVKAKASQNDSPPTTPMIFMNVGGGSSASSAAAVGSGYGMHTKRRSKSVAILLNVVGYIGIGGLHRFYTGHTTIGVIQLLTFGGFFIWQIMDLLMILFGSYRDAYGKRLVG